MSERPEAAAWDAEPPSEAAGPSASCRAAKRAFDVVSSLAVVAAAPVLSIALCAFVARDAYGSPICLQERVGMGGRLFRILRFCTMVAGSDDAVKHLNAEQMEQCRRECKVDGDSRITPLGRRLCAMSLDELPQFLNVHEGDILLRILKTC